MRHATRRAAPLPRPKRLRDQIEVFGVCVEELDDAGIDVHQRRIVHSFVREDAMARRVYSAYSSRRPALASLCLNPSAMSYSLELLKRLGNN
eukprot:5881142-Alexandrium_andersonii.AAC.1